MTAGAPPLSDDVAHALLDAVSRSCADRDLTGVLDLFSTDAAATYSGSEVAEVATGAAALRQLFQRLFAREAVYTFRFADVRWAPAGSAGWIWADGEGEECVSGQVRESFAYRLAGVVVAEAGRWRWVMLAGSEPARSSDPGIGGVPR